MSGVALNQKLLAFSREQSLALEGLDLGRELQFLEPLLAVTLQEQITCHLDAPDDLWPVLADRALLQSALLNLAVNARDAMGDKGALKITASNVHLSTDSGKGGLAGEYVAIEVADNGEGMDEKTIAQAFQPFFTTKDFGEGSGLGLSMVYGFVKQSGGHVEIDSTPSEGSRITIYLPRAEIVENQASSRAEVDHTALGQDERILLVEDKEEMRRALAMQLADLGFQAIEAEDAKEALRLLEDDVPMDLMLTDIVMPGGMDGRDLARHVRERFPHLPIMFMSGYQAKELQGALLDAHGVRASVSGIDQVLRRLGYTYKKRASLRMNASGRK